MNIEVFFAQYGGWVGLALYFLYKQVWPLFAKKLVPSKLEEQKADREFRRKMEMRSVEALDGINTSTQALAGGMIQTNERIANILTNQLLLLGKQDLTQKTLTDAVADMKETRGASRRKKVDDPE